MRRLLLGFGIAVSVCLMFCGLCFAAGPYLTAIPPSADEQIQGVKGTVNGVDFTTPYALHPSSGKLIVYDCSGLGSGKWEFVNIRAYNMRGEGPGVPFTCPSTPSGLTGLGIEP